MQYQMEDWEAENWLEISRVVYLDTYMDHWLMLEKGRILQDGHEKTRKRLLQKAAERGMWSIVSSLIKREEDEEDNLL